MIDRPRIAIVGAGFSGLTLGYALHKRGLKAQIFESQNKPGGMIQTSHSPIIAEHAAHALLASLDVENLFQDCGIELVPALPSAKKKWIFRGHPKRMPLHFLELLGVFKIFFKKSVKAGETLDKWLRHSAINDYLLSPALQGVYAAQTDRLSASLVMGSIFEKSLKSIPGKLRGSVAPKNGMHEILEALAKKFPVEYNWKGDLKGFDAVVIATSIQEAASFVPELSKVPKLSISAVTLGFSNKGSRISGFGCLFPKKEGFRSLGVLFNTDIFPNRGPGESETWIFDQDFENFSQDQILNEIRRDRKRLTEDSYSITSVQIAKWKDRLPLYGIELENFLRSDLFDVQPTNLKSDALRVFQQGAKIKNSNMYLTGNYLGGLGLNKILSYNHRLANRISKELK